MRYYSHQDNENPHVSYLLVFIDVAILKKKRGHPKKKRKRKGDIHVYCGRDLPWLAARPE
jgi:hypothetical protein